jgi:hypothetical protein
VEKSFAPANTPYLNSTFPLFSKRDIFYLVILRLAEESRCVAPHYPSLTKRVAVPLALTGDFFVFVNLHYIFGAPPKGELRETQCSGEVFFTAGLKNNSVVE